MSQALARREQLTERVMLKLGPELKRRLYAKAAKDGRTVSDFARDALVLAMAWPSRSISSTEGKR